MFKLKSITSLLAVTILTAGTQTSASTISVDPVPVGDVPPDGTVIVTLKGNEFNGTFGGGVNVSWNPKILKIADLNTDVILSFPDRSLRDQKGRLDNSTGTLSDISVSGLEGTTEPAFNIASITFTAVGSGPSPIDIEVGVFDMGGIDVWSDFAGAEIDVTYLDGSVTVVPLPATAWLFASCIAGLGAFGRKFANKTISRPS